MRLADTSGCDVVGNALIQLPVSHSILEIELRFMNRLCDYSVTLNTAALLLGFTLASGCGSADVANRPDRVPVKGLVTYNGAPLAGATVVFSPVAHDHGAAGITNDAGEFVLQTFDPGDGAVPGKYQITVRKVEMVEGRAVKSTESGGGEGGVEQSQSTMVEKFIIPERYARADTSGLSEEVSESGTNEFKIAL